MSISASGRWRGGVEKKRACNYEKRGLKEKVETQRQNRTEEEKEVLSVQERKTAEGSGPQLRKSPFIGHQKGQEGTGAEELSVTPMPTVLAKGIKNF